jgi:hypothetical protein
MARPRTRKFTSSCKFTVPSTFVIYGKHLGAVGSLVTVELTSDDGYTWTPSPIHGVAVLAGECVQVTSTPADTRGKGAGLGDLTITVTNVGGVKSNEQSQEIYYSP